LFRGALRAEVQGTNEVSAPFPQAREARPGEQDIEQFLDIFTMREGSQFSTEQQGRNRVSVRWWHYLPPRCISSIYYLRVVDKFILMTILIVQSTFLSIMSGGRVSRLRRTTPDAQHPFSIALTIRGVLTEQGDSEQCRCL
jgi:hypothetical protein